MALSWLSLQSRLFLLKCVSLLYAAVPFKRAFLGILGGVAGAAYVAAHIARLGRLRIYMDATAPETGLFIFALKYYSTYARIYLWSHLLYADARALRSYVGVEGCDLVKRAIEEKRGMILLGCHYGPPFIMPLLRDICGIPVRAMTGERIRFNVSTALRPLLTPKMRYLADEETFLAGRDTAKIVRHIREGGALYMLNDLASTGPGVTAVDFLGRKIKFSNFPFKASLNYSVPIFFCILKEDGPSRYRLVLSPCDPGLGIEEGLKSYASLVSEQIKSSPYKWTLGNDFYSWPEAGD